MSMTTRNSRPFAPARPMTHGRQPATERSRPHAAGEPPSGTSGAPVASCAPRALGLLLVSCAAALCLSLGFAGTAHAMTTLDVSQGDIYLSLSGAVVRDESGNEISRSNDFDGYRIIGSTDKYGIEVMWGSRGTPITLAGVNIDFTKTSSPNKAPLYIGPNTSADLTLEGENALTARYIHAAIEVPKGAAVSIQGPGKLTAHSRDYGAGVGGADAGDCGKVVISGGVVEASSGGHVAGSPGAGIGGGRGGAGGEVVISGGTVHAKGNNGAQGIGGGAQSASKGSFTTTDNGVRGNAVIFASSIGDTSYKTDASTQGVVFEGDSGTVYGNPILTDSFDIPQNATLSIASGRKIALGKDIKVGVQGKLVNDGELALNENATADIQGAIVNGGELALQENAIADVQGTIANDGAITGTGKLAIANKGAATGAGSLGADVQFSVPVSASMISVDSSRQTAEPPVSLSLWGRTFDPKAYTTAYTMQGATTGTVEVAGSNTEAARATLTGSVSRTFFTGAKEGALINTAPLMFQEAGGAKQYSVDGGSSWKDYAGTFYVFGSSTETAANAIEVQSGTHDISLVGVNISSSSNPPLSVAAGATANLALEEGTTNILENTSPAAFTSAGLSCAGAVTVKGKGSLDSAAKASSLTNSSPGIYVPEGGSLAIESGHVSATGSSGAGIGTGSNSSTPVGTISISGGEVTAQGNDGGAGIGRGAITTHLASAPFGSITISGGDVKAYCGDSYYGGGDGIGNGNGSNGSGSIALSGGTVLAVGGKWTGEKGNAAFGFSGQMGVSPAEGTAIEASLGDDEGSLAEMAGSPFLSKAGGHSIAADKRVFSGSTVPAYGVAVKSGTAKHASGDAIAQAAEGQVVTVVADAPPTSKQFKEWSGAEGLSFVEGTSATSSTAKFAMPAKAVSLTATYGDIPSNLTGITAPAAVTGIDAGTPLDDIPLPSTVTIATTQGDKLADVSWDRTSADPPYDPDATAAQTFTITGAVTLPDGVTNADSLALSTTVSVTVDAPKPPEPVVYSITEGANAQWTKGSKDGLRLVADGSFDKFAGLLLDGQPVDHGSYTAQSGSTVVVLKAAYLQTLVEGNHALRIAYNDGYAETALTVKAAPGEERPVDPDKPTQPADPEKPGTPSGKGGGDAPAGANEPAALAPTGDAALPAPTLALAAAAALGVLAAARRRARRRP